MFYWKRHGVPIWETYNLEPSKQIVLMAAYDLEMDELKQYMDEHKDDMIINPDWLPYYILPGENDEPEMDIELLKKLAKYSQ